jgi:ABC-type nitrate/sulfonate/bicarbonate transport system ATPase subunit
VGDQHEDIALSRVLFPPQAALPAATVARTIGLRRSPVLDGLDLHVAAGELVAVVGRPGTGKTTLVRALDGLEPLDGGRVDVATRRRTIDDRAPLLHWRRVAGNVRAGVPATAALSVDDALEIVGLGHRTTAGPAGLTTEEVARVKLARALRHDPALLLLDGLLDGILPAGRTALARTLRAASRELDSVSCSPPRLRTTPCRSLIACSCSTTDTSRPRSLSVSASDGRVTRPVTGGFGRR